jgi:hypothetical protein
LGGVMIDAETVRAPQTFDMACRRIENAMAQGTLLHSTAVGEQQALEL